MWLQARSEVHTETNTTSYAEYVDVTLDYDLQAISLRICFGGVELGTDDPGMFDYFQPFHEMLESGIRELCISFEVPVANCSNTFTSFTLTLFPEEQSVLSAYVEGRIWYHFKIKEWYFAEF